MLVDKVNSDRELAYAFARSIGADFAGTLSQLFNLTDEQDLRASAVTRDHGDSLSHIGRVLVEALGTDYDLELSVDMVSPKAKEEKKEEDKKGIDWEIGIKGTVDTDKKGTVEVGVTIKF